VPGHALQYCGWKIGQHLHPTGAIRSEGNVPPAVTVLIKLATSVVPAARLAVQSLARVDDHGSFRSRSNLVDIKPTQDFENVCLRTPAAEVGPTRRLRILNGGRNVRNLRSLHWIVPIQELLPERPARRDIVSPFAVVGDEEPKIRISNQVQIAVEVHGVATMSDDAMPVARFLIEAQRHSIHLRIEPKLPRVHQLRSFWLENLFVFEPPILQVSNHESGDISGGRRESARRHRLHELERFDAV